MDQSKPDIEPKNALEKVADTAGDSQLMEETKREPTEFQKYVDQKLTREEEYKKMIKELESKEEYTGLSLREKVQRDLEFQEKSGQMLDELHEQYDKMNERMNERMQEARNGHDKLMLVNEMLEGMLEHVKAAMPKEEFKNIDNTPKHLLHMTDEDL